VRYHLHPKGALGRRSGTTPALWPPATVGGQERLVSPVPPSGRKREQAQGMWPCLPVRARDQLLGLRWPAGSRAVTGVTGCRADVPGDWHLTRRVGLLATVRLPIRSRYPVFRRMKVVSSQSPMTSRTIPATTKTS
jgi:hypothetical protein